MIDSVCSYRKLQLQFESPGVTVFADIWKQGVQIEVS